MLTGFQYDLMIVQKWLILDHPEYRNSWAAVRVKAAWSADLHFRCKNARTIIIVDV